jgi:hypothetical protein
MTSPSSVSSLITAWLNIDRFEALDNGPTRREYRKAHGSLWPIDFSLDCIESHHASQPQCCSLVPQRAARSSIAHFPIGRHAAKALGPMAVAAGPVYPPPQYDARARLNHHAAHRIGRAWSHSQ